jgi:hypothetical protein
MVVVCARLRMQTCNSRSVDGARHLIALYSPRWARGGADAVCVLLAAVALKTVASRSSSVHRTEHQLITSDSRSNSVPAIDLMQPSARDRARHRRSRPAVGVFEPADPSTDLPRRDRRPSGRRALFAQRVRQRSMRPMTSALLVAGERSAREPFAALLGRGEPSSRRPSTPSSTSIMLGAA